MTLILTALALWAAGFALNVALANGSARDTQVVRLAVPLIFGATLLMARSARGRKLREI